MWKPSSENFYREIVLHLVVWDQAGHDHGFIVEGGANDLRSPV